MKTRQSKKVIVLSVLILSFIGAKAQEETFKPSGKAFMKVYTNYHSTFSDGNTLNAFEIQRAYFGYSAKFSKNISGKMNLDVGNPGVGGLEMTAYLKNAFLQYKKDKFLVNFGLIGLHQFKLQEKLWGGRYLYKSFQDQYKFGPSADLGLHASYKLHEMVSADITIANGEGYKKVEADSLLKYSAGITISPIDELDIRVYYDIMGSDSAQQSLSFYAGYSTEKIRVGAEYNQQLNHKVAEGQDMSGLSFYASYQLEKVRIFTRFDQLSSVKIGNATDPWNYGKDGQFVFLGFEFSPVKGILITPNYQGWMPANGNPIVNTAYLSCEIKF